MSLLKSAATVGGLTMVSRILGFVRDQLIAFTLGTGFVASAFSLPSVSQSVPRPVC
jgi:putative peptidoglycan lipid II flippase